MRYNEASVSQTGDENTSVVLQSGVNGAVGDPDGNYGSADAAALVGVTQFGDGNGSVITQTGDNTVAEVFQLGNDNVSSINHAGNFSNAARSEEHTSELQSLMRISYAVFCLKNKKRTNTI